MRMGTAYGSSPVIRWYISNRLPYFSATLARPSRRMASAKSRYTPSPPGGGDVAALSVGGQEEDVAVAAGGQHDGVREVGRDLAGDQVADHYAAGPAVHHDQLEHLVPGVHLDGAGGDLAFHRLVRAEQQLLARLPPGVEGAGHLGAAERAVVEQAAVLTGERH